MATNAYETEQISGVIPYLTVDGAAAAADFYRAAFAAREINRQPPDEKGRLMHVHLQVNGGSVMLSDGFEEYGHPALPAQGFMLHLQVDSCDAWFDRAIAAGATCVTAPHDAFWGDRYAQLRDPFGIVWTIGSAR